MFRVMQEVKAREEEYNLIKGLLSAIEGLASLSSLARRERRLLVRGPCQLLVSRSQARSRRNSNGDRQPNILPDPNTKWDKRLEKRRSLLPVSSPDVNPNDFASSASPSKAISGGSTSGYDLVFSPVEVLVFSDVVVMATPTGKGRWKLVDELGIARILNVTECTVVTQGDIGYNSRNKSLTLFSQGVKSTLSNSISSLSTTFSWSRLMWMKVFLCRHQSRAFKYLWIWSNKEVQTVKKGGKSGLPR